MTAQYQLLPDLTEEEYAALKADIEARGVQVPIELDDTGAVLDGHHRLRACEELGIDEYPTIIRAGMDDDEKREHVLALNLDRRHLTREQRQELVGMLRAEGWSYPRIAARLNVGVGTAHGDAQAFSSENVVAKTGGEFSPPGDEPATVTGTDGKQYPASRPKPSVFAATPKEAQQTLTAIRGAGDKELPGGILTPRQAAKATRPDPPPAPPIPEGKFSVVYADPPWQYNNSGLAGAAAGHYPTMPTDDLCDLQIAEHLAENATLFLWVTNPLLIDGLAVLSAWAFDYKTNFVWVKDRECYGKLGFYNYGQHELLMVGVRGSHLPTEGSLVPSLIDAAKREHSRKPDEAYAIIEAMYPDARRLELFARATREGWTSWGNEVEKWA